MAIEVESTDIESADTELPPVSAQGGGPVLEVADLEIEYRIGPTWRTAVRDVSFSIAEGEALGLVGESGCGKSTVAMAIMNYLPRNGRVVGGEIRLRDSDLSQQSKQELRDLRINQLSIVYQDPATSLNPSIRVGRQVGEVFSLMGHPSGALEDLVAEALERVQIADPVAVMRRYPHQLSGGMLQRVVIAMAIAKEPDLLVLDEPTTGLDATVEAEVLDLINRLRRQMGTAVLFVSHNLGVVERMCDRTAVLYAGRLAAVGPSGAVLGSPRHPYTLGLLRSLPTSAKSGAGERLETIPGFLPPLGASPAGCIYVDRCPIVQDVCRTVMPPAVELDDGRLTWCHFPERVESIEPRNLDDESTAESVVGETFLEIENATMTFWQGGREARACVGVDLSIAEGETVALVGESGSGKSTLAKLILGIHEPDPCTKITLDGKVLAPSILDRTADELRAIQIVFQNPDSALNRRHVVRRIIGRAVSRLRGDRNPASRVQELTRSVRMGEQTLSVRPAQLSGGLKQRVAIARAFAGTPRLVVADEPTSALDVSVQAAILNLLDELQEQDRVSYLFISHDLNVVRYIADRVAVMYLGRILEDGPSEAVFEGPNHPYTEALLSATPEREDQGRIRLSGEIPSPSHTPSGCVFHTRCPHKLSGGICEEQEPPVRVVGEHSIRCHIPTQDLVEIQGVLNRNPTAAGDPR